MYNNIKIYLKYKTKYLNLKSQIGAHKNIIKLDNYVFEIKYKSLSVKDTDRDKYFLYSYLESDPTTIYKFIFYRSNSELDFLRLINFINARTIDKGEFDYVQQSFIDLRLQKFINQHNDTIPTIKKEDIESSEFKDLLTEDSEFIDHINDPHRLLSIEPFNKMDIKCGSTSTRNDFVFLDGIIKSLKDLSDNIETKYEIRNNKYLHEYKKETYGNFRSMYDITEEIKGNQYRGEGSTKRRFDRDKIAYDQMISDVESNKIKVDEMNYFTQIEFYMFKRLNELKKVQVVKEEDEFKKFLEIEYETRNRLKDYYNLKICSVELVPKDSTDNNNLILYYMICTFCFYDNIGFLRETTKRYNWDFFLSTTNTKLGEEYQNKECKYNDIYVPIFLTTANSTITKYGTYSNYIPAGIYICKFLEYHKQCTDEEREYCSRAYAFIADRYYDIYPLNKIANTDLINQIVDNKTKEEIEKYLKDPLKSDPDKVKSLINEYNKNTLKTPLIYAIESNNIDVVKFLLDKGADVNYINNINKKTILSYAEEKNNPEIIQLIRSKLL
jgi:hypothetical protein